MAVTASEARIVVRIETGEAQRRVREFQEGRDRGERETTRRRERQERSGRERRRGGAARAAGAAGVFAGARSIGRAGSVLRGAATAFGLSTFPVFASIGSGLLKGGSMEPAPGDEVGQLARAFELRMAENLRRLAAEIDSVRADIAGLFGTVGPTLEVGRAQAILTGEVDPDALGDFARRQFRVSRADSALRSRLNFLIREEVARVLADRLPTGALVAGKSLAILGGGVGEIYRGIQNTMDTFK